MTSDQSYVLVVFRLHQMHEIWTIAIDNPVVCQSVRLSVTSYFFARWRHFDVAVTTLL